MSAAFSLGTSRKKLIFFWQTHQRVSNFLEKRGIYATEAMAAYIVVYTASQAAQRGWDQIKDWKIDEAFCQLYRHKPAKRPKFQQKSSILRFVATWDAWSLRKYPTINFSSFSVKDNAETFLMPAAGGMPARNQDLTEKIRGQIEALGGVWKMAELAFLENLEKGQQKQKFKQQQLFSPGTGDNGNGKGGGKC